MRRFTFAALICSLALAIPTAYAADEGVTCQMVKDNSSTRLYFVNMYNSYFDERWIEAPDLVKEAVCFIFIRTNDLPKTCPVVGRDAVGYCAGLDEKKMQICGNTVTATMRFFDFFCELSQPG